MKIDGKEYQERLVFETQRAEKLEKDLHFHEISILAMKKTIDRLNKEKENLPCLLAEYASCSNNWDTLANGTKNILIQKAREFLKNKKAKT